MAVDVLAYNEIARINNALQCYVDQCVAPGVAAGCTAGKACGLCAATDFVTAAVATSCTSGINTYFAQNPSIPTTLISQCFQANYGNGGSTCDLWSRPWDCTTWASIPTLSGAFSCIAVCDATYGRCGASCTWTVPSGVTTARFQLWGAGAGVSGACGAGCSSFSSPVSSGAYASVILPVTAGSIYCFCAGCARCCYGGISPAACGCASWVAGPNLCNLCADGGDASPLTFLTRSIHGGCSVASCVIFAKGQCCSYAGKGNYYGPCLCTGGWFCSANMSCISQGPSCYSTSCSIIYGCVTNADKACHVVVGAPGIYPWVCIYGGDCGIIYMPPMIGCCSAAVCGRQFCASAAGSSGCSYTNPCGYPCFAYGQSAPPSAAYAANFCCGSPGSGGLVLVHYC